MVQHASQWLGEWSVHGIIGILKNQKMESSKVKEFCHLVIKISEDGGRYWSKKENIKAGAKVFDE